MITTFERSIIVVAIRVRWVFVIVTMLRGYGFRLLWWFAATLFVIAIWEWRAIIGQWWVVIHNGWVVVGSVWVSRWGLTVWFIAVGSFLSVND